MQQRPNRTVMAVLLVLLATPALLKAGEKPLAVQVTESVGTAVAIRQETQKKEEAWAREKEKLSLEYEALEARNSYLISVNSDLSVTHEEKSRTVSGLKRQLQEISTLSGALLPYLKVLCQSLKTAVEQDVPMLKTERLERISRLESLLNDSGVSASEAYRKTMETLFVEAEYGNTIEVYPEKVLLEGEPILVDVFRLGRISLFCQTPDGKKAGVYNRAQSAWQTLNPKYLQDINRAVAMGEKRQPIDFLDLPIGKVVSQ
ncbi:MAG: DUF3450 domain-containing protein [Pseudomonadota bacterium]